MKSAPNLAAGVVVVVLVLAPMQIAAARLIQLWSYEDLMKKSDVVVIATVESESEFDGAVEIPQFREVLTPQVTSFAIAGVLKGEHEDKQLELVHCRLTPEGQPVINGPLLAQFQAKGRTIRIESDEQGRDGAVVKENKPSYLLFLKARDDGRYEPVAGQIDSDLSVRQVTPGVVGF